ncbi:MAG TPA: GSU2403 family nucleotidyltransferase fold protein [Myxococcota bacterium]|nr:hypothetical protein [Myxococcota bacterium]HNZ03425.1 GSU2403 family nucleotidyltransferase fold protein [Myxococcota bacterium]HOD07613.1 GSU2403 family nucleotidyltransferase fold protein [Myxococcota bacterium]HPB49725.1 GSU2403 family nucleotidyltransferase fold protein [Myxococcota bacterium]HQP94725.1 GSU2403 family nucleotidyltransferase fold protein [Myxococcota bacterium]
MVAEQHNPGDILHDLGRLIKALGEYRTVAVLTGGFVPLIYRSMPGLVSPPTPPLLTTDFDWTVPARLELLGGRSISERLKDSEFVAIPSLGTEPAVIRFQPSRFGTERLGPVYAEFLAPLVGSDADRRGVSRDVVVVQPGLTAQALRYLDILLVEPIPFDACTIPEIGLDETSVILLPSPAGFVLQKLLAWPSREPEKRPKDLAYVYEVAILTQKQWSCLAEVVNRLRDGFPSTWFDRVSSLIRREFRSHDSNGPVAVVRQYMDFPGRAPSTKAVWHTVNDFAKSVGMV